MDYTRYSRAVILFEERSREFAADPKKEMKGYLRVETGNGRGAFRCVIQNIRFFPRSEYTYQLILFGRRGERTIHTVAGTIPVTRYGTGEVYLRFRPQDVDGQGNDYQRYTAVIVAAVSSKNRNEQLHPVLMGRTGHQPEETAHIAEPAQVSAMGASAPWENGSRTPASNGQSATDNSQSPAGSSGVQENDKQARADGSQPQAENDGAQESDKKTQTDGRRPQGPEDRQKNAAQAAVSQRAALPTEKSAENYNRFYNAYLRNICRYFWSVCGYYEEIQPFQPDPFDARWLKIANPKSMFFVSPGAQHFSTKYGHFLLGCRQEAMYYLAIPGRFRKEEQPDGGESGFCYWQPLGQGERNEETYGYWIAAIDGESGDVLAPIPG